jgi:hypothetical protein
MPGDQICLEIQKQLQNPAQCAPGDTLCQQQAANSCQLTAEQQLQQILDEQAANETLFQQLFLRALIEQAAIKAGTAAAMQQLNGHSGLSAQDISDLVKNGTLSPADLAAAYAQAAQQLAEQQGEGSSAQDTTCNQDQGNPPGGTAQAMSSSAPDPKSDPGSTPVPGSSDPVPGSSKSVPGSTTPVSGSFPGATAEQDAAYQSLLDEVEKADVSSPVDGATFWSGRSAKGESMRDFANTDGVTSKTLNQTPGGEWLQNEHLFRPGSPVTESQANALWTRMSERYAEEAQGEVAAYVHDSPTSSVWSSKELDTLMHNPKVTQITIKDPISGAVSVWTR